MGSTNRVLLVDDEPKIVEALQRLLRPLRETWTVVTATSAKVALELLGREPFDIVVSDMRMPEMDGAALLAIVKERFPGTARVILSGQTEKSAAMRAVAVSHQVLQKPCPSNTLIDLLARRALYPLSDVGLRQHIGALESLPCDADTATALSALVAGGKARLPEITTLVKNEPVLILRFLQLATSPFFETMREGDDLIAAISVASEDLLQTLATAARESSATKISAKHFDRVAFRSHAIEIGYYARSTAGESPHADACFIAGMLHEIGKIVLAAHAPDAFDAVAARASEEDTSFEVAEDAEGVQSHASVGAALLDLWGFPQPIVAAVASQNDRIDDDAPFGPAAAVRLAHREISLECEGSP